MTVRRWRTALAIALVVSTTCAAIDVVQRVRTPFVQVRHCATEYAHRSGFLTANVTGDIGPLTSNLRYRLNGGDWRDVELSSPRVVAPEFVVEFTADDLATGRNVVEFSGNRCGLWSESCEQDFEYSPVAVALPVEVQWSLKNLDVQDGHWETVGVGSETRLRPVPGREGYDRIVAVTGAFSGGRRVEVDLTFRRRASDELFGFGVLPLWGGHPGSETSPRSGWIYSAAWYYSHANGVGQEFARATSNNPSHFVTMYRAMQPVPDAQYHIVVECWPVSTQDDMHSHFTQRTKWWQQGDPEPVAWMTLTDKSGGRLPAGEYSVALVAHRCQVEFGKVRVLPLEKSKSVRSPGRLAIRSAQVTPAAFDRAPD